MPSLNYHTVYSVFAPMRKIAIRQKAYSDAQISAVIRLADQLIESGWSSIKLKKLFGPIQTHTCSWSGYPALARAVVTHENRSGRRVYVLRSVYERMARNCDACARVSHSSEMRPYWGRRTGAATAIICNGCVDESSNFKFAEAEGCFYDRRRTDEEIPPSVRVPLGSLPKAERKDIRYSSGPTVPIGKLNDATPWPVRRLEATIKAYSTDVLATLAGAAFRFDVTETLPITPLWLGVELEVAPKLNENSGGPIRRNYVEEIHKDTSDFAIMKSDGSIPSGGVEIVTVPATIGAHRILWRRFFQNSARMVSGWSERSCGMHIHMSRAALGSYTIGKMLVFINDRPNIPFIEKVAGRGETSYTKFSIKKLADGARNTGDNRYDALAASTRNGGKTVELRIFRSNVAEGGFFKNLDFAVALSEFCREASPQQLSSKMFLSWLSLPDIQPRFPYLTQWAAREKLVAVRQRVREEEDFIPA